VPAMATTTKQDRVRELQRALYRAAKADSRMPAVKNVGEPCAGEPHARFEAAAGGNRNQSAIAVRNWAPPADPTVLAGVCCGRFSPLVTRKGASPVPCREGWRENLRCPM